MSPPRLTRHHDGPTGRPPHRGRSQARRPLALHRVSRNSLKAPCPVWSSPPASWISSLRSGYSVPGSICNIGSIAVVDPRPSTRSVTPLDRQCMQEKPDADYRAEHGATTALPEAGRPESAGRLQFQSCHSRELTPRDAVGYAVEQPAAEGGQDPASRRLHRHLHAAHRDPRLLPDRHRRLPRGALRRPQGVALHRPAGAVRHPARRGHRHLHRRPHLGTVVLRATHGLAEVGGGRPEPRVGRPDRGGAPDPRRQLQPDRPSQATPPRSSPPGSTGSSDTLCTRRTSCSSSARSSCRRTG